MLGPRYFMFPKVAARRAHGQFEPYYIEYSFWNSHLYYDSFCFRFL